MRESVFCLNRNCSALHHFAKTLPCIRNAVGTPRLRFSTPLKIQGSAARGFLIRTTSLRKLVFRELRCAESSPSSEPASGG
jgi:hypothetical protein